MKKSQIALLAVAAVAVALIAFLGSSGGKDDKPRSSSSAKAPEKAPAGAINVSFAYSPEKEKLLTPLVERFNASGAQVDGKRVFVTAQNVSSGEAQTKIAAGRLNLTSWSPSSSLWGRLLNFEADQPYAPDTNPSIVRTPLVIAMWEPMARALGYPKRKLGFADILKLARSNQGWGAYGRPELGQFKLVHTNPDFSTSGLSAVVAEYYSSTGKKEGLTTADIKRARPQVKDIERSIVHYGDTTLFISDELRKRGPGYASAVAMEEATLVDFNLRRGNRQKLIAIYPAEGTFYSDNPYITLDAPWVTGPQRVGAKAFGEYLEQNIDGKTAARFGFRPSDLQEQPSAPLNAANGVDPRQPARVLGLPEPRVLAAVKKTWREDRKPANVLLVLDTSGSMNDEGRLESAKDGLQTFLREVAPQDRVGLTIFNDRITPLAPIAPIRNNRGRAARARVAAHRRRRHGDLRRDRRGCRAGRKARRHEPHQRRRAAHRRGGHGLVEDRRLARARARRPGRLVAARARVHDRLLGRCRGRGPEPRADRQRVRRQAVRRHDRRHRDGLPQHQLVLLSVDQR